MDFSKLFICPGAQKAGTTWLHRALRKHPGFWMPPQKELDYLFFYRPSREKYANRMGAKLKDPGLKPVAREWMSLFVQDWNLATYPRLFEHAGDRFSGDISPNYSRMSGEEVCRAREVIPGAKVVLILRDPVERAWSHAKNASKTWNIPDRTARLEKCSRFVNSAVCDLMSDYPRLVRQWSGQFGEDNVLVLFYEQLARDPEFFIDSVLAFIGAAPYPRAMVEQLHERPNEGELATTPDDVRNTLRKRYAPMLADLRNVLASQSKLADGAPDWLTGE
jgi:Sulfotransferase family